MGEKNPYEVGRRHREEEVDFSIVKPFGPTYVWRRLDIWVCKDNVFFAFVIVFP